MVEIIRVIKPLIHLNKRLNLAMDNSKHNKLLHLLKPQFNKPNQLQMLFLYLQHQANQITLNITNNFGNMLHTMEKLMLEQPMACMHHQKAQNLHQVLLYQFILIHHQNSVKSEGKYFYYLLSSFSL